MKGQQLEDQIDTIWKDYSLDAPKLLNPIPQHTRGLRGMCLVTHFILPLCKFTLGLGYMHLCPTNQWVPAYLVIGGIVQIVFLIILIYRPFRHPLVLTILGISLLTWGVFASANIMVEWQPDFFLGGWRYCHRSFFYFAFFVSVTEYTIIGLVLLYICTQYGYDRNPNLTEEIV